MERTYIGAVQRVVNFDFFFLYGLYLTNPSLDSILLLHIEKKLLELCNGGLILICLENWKMRNLINNLIFYPLAQLFWRRGYSIWFVRPWVLRPSHQRAVVLSALFLKRGKAMDFESYANLLLIYCSCAPRIQFVQKSIFRRNFRSKRDFLHIKADINVWSKSCVRFSSKGVKLWISNPMLNYSWYIVVVHLVFSLSKNPNLWSNFRSKLR